MPLLFWRLPRIFLLLLNKAQDLFLLPTKPQALPPGHLALRLVWHCHLCGTPSMRSASCPHYVWMSLFPALHMAGSFSSFAFSWMLQTQKCLPKNVFPFIPPVRTTSPSSLLYHLKQPEISLFMCFLDCYLLISGMFCNCRDPPFSGYVGSTWYTAETS